MFVEVMSASRFVLQPDLSRVHAEPLKAELLEKSMIGWAKGTT